MSVLFMRWDEILHIILYVLNSNFSSLYYEELHKINS